MDMDVQVLLNFSEIPYIYWVESWVNFTDSLDVVAKRNVPAHVRNLTLVILPIFSRFTDWTILTQKRKIQEFII